MTKVLLDTDSEQKEGVLLGKQEDAVDNVLLLRDLVLEEVKAIQYRVPQKSQGAPCRALECG